MKIHWTYSKIDLKPSEVLKHESKKCRKSDHLVHIGGLDRKPIFTHCITADGRLFTLDYCPGMDINLAVIGGVNSDYRFANTITSDQLLTLSNIVKFYASLGEPVLAGDFGFFDFKTWIKAILKN